VTQYDPRVTATAVTGRSPLRRRIDDLEARIFTGLVVFFLLAAPVLAVVAGGLTDSASLRERHAESGWRPVTAVLDQSAAEGLIGVDDDWGAALVAATWARPAGVEHTGLIAVALNARAGQRLKIWVSSAGRITPPPLSRADIADRVACAVLAMLAGLVVLLAIVAGVVRAMTTRRRLADWGRGWAVVAPRWSSDQ